MKKIFFSVFRLGVLLFSLALVFGLSNPLRSTSAIISIHPFGDPAFTPNLSQGWDTLNTYIIHSADSVVFELILKCDSSTNKDWNQLSEVGILSQEFWPAELVEFNYVEPKRIWQVTIYQDGRCFLRLVEGPNPDNNPAVIPIVSGYRP